LTDGACFLTALILNNKITIANLGDSTALLVRDGQMLEMTSEQVPSRVDEFQRIQNCGGSIFKVGNNLRVDGALSVTRAIGDAGYKASGVISEPELNQI
jgi:serine/threonine protein phosphatase PrpC